MASLRNRQRNSDPGRDIVPASPGNDSDTGHQGSGVVDNAIYVDGVRTVSPSTLDQTYELLRERRGLAWIGLYRPTPEQIQSVATELGLHPLAVEDAIKAHQRPKLERYGDILFAVL